MDSSHSFLYHMIFELKYKSKFSTVLQGALPWRLSHLKGQGAFMVAALR